ncbi:hypothetical protein MN608_01576 [Microdochium nivale]|nr:hypothetical protein MN608_01576 [Microdochium nivale]
MSLWCVRRPQCAYSKCKRTVVTGPGRPPAAYREAQSPHCEHHTCLIWFSPADGVPRCRNRVRRGTQYCVNHGICYVPGCQETVNEAQGHKFCARLHECTQNDCKNPRRPGGTFGEYTAACADHACEAQGDGQCSNLKGSPRGNPSLCTRHNCSRRGCEAEVPGHDTRGHRDNFCDDHKACPGLEGEPQGCGRPLWRFLSPGPAHVARVSGFCQNHTCFATRTDGELQLVADVCTSPVAPGGALACAAHKCQVSHVNCPRPKRSRSAPGGIADVAACLYCVNHECKRDDCTFARHPGVDFCAQHMCLANQLWGLTPAGQWDFRGAAIGRPPAGMLCNNKVEVDTGGSGRAGMVFPSWCKEHRPCPVPNCVGFCDVDDGRVAATCADHLPRRRCYWPLGCDNRPDPAPSRGCHLHRCATPSCPRLRRPDGGGEGGVHCREHTCVEESCRNPRSTTVSASSRSSSTGALGGNNNAATAAVAAAVAAVGAHEHRHHRNNNSGRGGVGVGNRNGLAGFFRLFQNNNSNAAGHLQQRRARTRHVHFRPNERRAHSPSSSSDDGYGYDERQEDAAVLETLQDAGVLPGPAPPNSMYCDSHRCFARGCTARRMGRRRRRGDTGGVGGDTSSSSDSSSDDDGGGEGHRARRRRRAAEKEEVGEEEVVYCEAHRCHFAAPHIAAAENLYQVHWWDHLYPPGHRQQRRRRRWWRCSKKAKHGGYCREHHHLAPHRSNNNNNNNNNGEAGWQQYPEEIGDGGWDEYGRRRRGRRYGSWVWEGSAAAAQGMGWDTYHGGDGGGASGRGGSHGYSAVRW